jgi:hypothetical protein
LLPTTGSTATVTGNGFVIGMTFQLLSRTGVFVNIPTWTLNSATSVTITSPDISSNIQPYSLVATLPSSETFTLDAYIIVTPEYTPYGSLPYFVSSVPSEISGNTASSSIIRNYTFNVILPLDSTLIWSIIPTTYGNIDNSGNLTITFPQNTIASGTFEVRATNSYGYSSQIWNYNLINYPINPWAILEASTLSLSNGSLVNSWGTIRTFSQTTSANQPTYYSTGGYNNGPYVFFNRTNSNFLNAGSQTMNISTNGGFTMMILIKLVGTAENFERIFDFGDNSVTNNIYLTRMNTTQNLLFEVYNPSTSTSRSIGDPIIQEQWIVIGCRYIKSSTLQIFKNTELLIQVNTSLNHIDRTFLNTYIGVSHSASAYLNAHISKLFLYDRALTDNEFNQLYTYIANKPVITSTVPNNIYYISNASYSFSYTFTGLSSSGNIIWSITPTTYGNINSSTGALTITFPANINVSGSFTVTATDNNSSVSQTWNYNLIINEPSIYTITNIGSTVWRSPSGVSAIDILIVGGGGGGGGGANRAGGGGGAGGVVYRTSYAITPNTEYVIKVGAGGLSSNANGSSGGDSSFDTLIALGGGYGTGYYTTPTNGGSGGGGGQDQSIGGSGLQPSSASGGYGNNGARGYYQAGGGGGGAGSAGVAGTYSGNGGNGGAGISNSITGSAVFYAGGGGGATELTSYVGGTGGTGGGGNGGKAGPGSNATYYGSGGGGGGQSGSVFTNKGGTGYQGIVIFKYV